MQCICGDGTGTCRFLVFCGDEIVCEGTVPARTDPPLDPHATAHVSFDGNAAAIARMLETIPGVHVTVPEERRKEQINLELHGTIYDAIRALGFGVGQEQGVSKSE